MLIDKKHSSAYAGFVNGFEKYMDAFQQIEFNLVQQNSTLESMNEFTENFAKVSEAQSHSTENVAESSSKIKEIAVNINEISDQTNLLALNVSLEQTEAVHQITIKTQHVSQESENILMSSMELGALVDELKRITGSLKELISLQPS
jgi:methyl-accepting chemotaxis protein